MIRSNYHTHTRYSDGKGEPTDFIEHAIKLGFSHLGFSDHAPVTFDNPWGLKWNEVGTYVRDIEKTKERYRTTINIYRALEIDYIPKVSFPFSFFRSGAAIDYTIGAVHLVHHPARRALWFINGSREEEFIDGLRDIFDNDTDYAVGCFYRQQIEMIQTERPDIIAHFDKIKMHNKGRYFDDESPMVREWQKELLKVIKAAGTVVEVNTRGIYKGRCDELYPSDRLIRACVKAGIPLMLSSDAHKPEEIDGYFSEARLMLRDAGVRKLVFFDGKKFTGYHL